MTTKLTLTIQQEVIQSAKTYAKINGRSLSDLVENYLMTLQKEDNSTEDFSPRVKRLLGAVKLPKDLDYKAILQEEIEKKYGQ